MSEQTVTLTLSDAELQTIDEIAANMEMDRAVVLRDMLEAYLASYEQEKAEVEEAERQIEAGETIAHEDVVAWLKARHPGLKDLNDTEAA